MDPMDQRNVYYPGIDALKGILILLVIAGHFLEGRISENPLRYIIYSFHMPLFLVLSGFLLNRERLRHRGTAHFRPATGPG